GPLIQSHGWVDEWRPDHDLDPPEAPVSALLRAQVGPVSPVFCYISDTFCTQTRHAEITGMDDTRTDSVPRSVTLTAYDFAMEEVTDASSKWARGVWARA